MPDTAQVVAVGDPIENEDQPLMSTRILAPGVAGVPGSSGSHGRWQAWLGRWDLLILFVAQLGLGALGVWLRPEGFPLAGWWPAAGMALAWMVRSSPRRWPGQLLVVIVATGLANLVFGGRPVLVAGLFGVANAVEALVISFLFCRTGPSRVHGVADLWRMLACSVGGAVPAGLVAATGTHLLGGGEFGGSFLTFLTAHPAGVMLVGPLFLLARDPLHRGRRWELVVQFATVSAVSVVTFTASNFLPLSFLPPALLLWAAARFTPRIAAAQTVLVSVLAAAMTVQGRGPFGVLPTDGGPFLHLRLAQLYLLVIVLCVLALALAVAQRDRAALLVARNEDLYRRTFDDAMLGMVILDREASGWRFVRANRVAAEFFDLAHHPDVDLPAQQVVDGIDEWLDERLGSTSVHTLRIPSAQADHRTLSVTLSPLGPRPGSGPSVVRVSLQLVDISEQVRAEQRLTEMAWTDPLTGLPNRALLQERMRRRLELDGGAAMLVMSLDLDDFKTVNDSSGHVVGDQVLLEISTRLQDAVPTGTTVARLGGDEFVVMQPHLEPAAGDAATVSEYGGRLAMTLIDAISEPVQLGGRQYRVGASVGISVSRPGVTSEVLLREADSAMFAAKGEGKNRFAVYSPAIHETAMRRLTLDAELHAAVQDEEFELHVQPVVDLRSGLIVAGEALVRWRHPIRGMLAPGEWLDIAEDGQVSTGLARWVIHEACRIAAGWPPLPGGRYRTIHVNVSARHLGTDRLLDDVASALAEAGLAPGQLVLELTETHLAREFEVVDGGIARMREGGVRLAVDDVGTGYSSLKRLADLPIDILKIDQTFVARMTQDVRANAVVEGLVTLGKAMQVEVVAEGVETEEQAARLRQLGCELGQGYLWSAAVPADRFLDLLCAPVRRSAGRVPGR